MSDWRDKVRCGLATALPGAGGRRTGRGLGPGPVHEAGVGSYVLLGVFLAIGACGLWVMWRWTDVVLLVVGGLVGLVVAFVLLTQVWQRVRGLRASDQVVLDDFGTPIMFACCLIATLSAFKVVQGVLEIRGDPDREIGAVSSNGETGP